ncbi:peptidoglycan bridge formation glycyltransferase FemA/FemB family protein [Candidatus Saccharibacteria bacterium]|nr:peptidoglycan bridge formation glycyltransferase FemA/FemB family protein [Candidatus Saccharibacteria bacterium]
MNPHFLQTSAWKHFQEALGRTTFEASGDGWHYMAVLEPGRFSRLYCPYGPTADSAASFKAALASLKVLAKKQGVHFIRIEPMAPLSPAALRRFGAVRARHSIQPQHTWCVDLTINEEDLLKNMNGNTRRFWQRGKEKYDISFRSSDDPADIEIFLDCIREVADRTGMRPHDDDYFRLQARTLLPLGAARLFITSVDGRPAAAILAYDTPTTRYYAHAAAHYEFHVQNVATVGIIFAMLEAKREGKTTFDLYGVAPPDAPADHPWQGFSRFKRTFGGAGVDYLGAWEIPVKPYWHRAYRLAGKAVAAKQALRRKLRRS